MDIIDGREVPPTHLSGVATLRTHQGSVIVDPGADVTITGALQGSLEITSGARASVTGAVQGSVHVPSGAAVQVSGAIQGSVHVARGGLVEVARSGKLQGSLHVDGVIRNGGKRGGTTSGAGVIEDLPGSHVVQPRTVREADGVIAHYYDW